MKAVAATEGRGFRVKLLLAMMLVVCAITGSALFFAQRSLRDAELRHLEHEFQGELRHLLSLEAVRLAAITERCRALANSVRIRAALEEDAIDDLYLNAEVELRDLLDRNLDRSLGDNGSLRAEFFRFLNGKGALISANPGNSPQSLQPWELELSLADGVPDTQQIGFVTARMGDDVEAMYQVVATPIIATESGEAIGALILGFKTAGGESQSGDMDLISGIWRRGRLQMPGLPDRAAAASLEAELSHSVSSAPTGTSLRVDVAGQPHLLFYTLLNANSKYPPTYQVCLFSLADSLEQQRELRWQILGSGCVLLLGAFGLSHFISLRLARPVEKLAKDSADNLEQKKCAEAALELTEQKYRSIFENAIEGIFLLSPEGRCLSANPAFARIYGYSSPAHAAAEFDKRRDQLFADPDGHLQMLRAAETHGVVSNFEAEVNRLDGTRIWISQNLRVVRDDSGTLLHFEGTVEDITARKHAADELLALNAELQAALGTLKATQQQIIQQERLRALGQMASGIAHDFNNALVPILGFCELLLIRPAILDDKTKAGAYLETIQTAAKDASSVVSRLREFYRADKGDKPFEPVNLKRLAEQIVSLTRPKWKDQAQAAGATIELVLELEPVPTIAGEESALREALTNLVFNAVDAMPKGGTITLRTRRTGDSAVLEISDTGTGMTDDVRRRCLEPFFSTKGERGTGLGLSMVFGIIQRHSGSVDIRSEPGVGTTFAIKLPLQDAVETKAAAAAPALKQSLRVLVVDDEAPVRESLLAILSADHHEVEIAVDGADGLRRFLAGKFDIVVTDKAMPGMSGDQLAAAIKKAAPQTPIILLTGFGLFLDKQDFPDVDILASKPIRIPALRDALANAMAAAA